MSSGFAHHLEVPNDSIDGLLVRTERIEGHPGRVTLNLVDCREHVLDAQPRVSRRHE
jgi:hypothetical protein